MADARYLVVETTVDSAAEADKLALLVLDFRLGACVQVIPGVSSKYFWKDKIEEAGEFILRIKSREDKYDALETLILANHPYEIPEIIAAKVKKISKGYANWLDTELDR